MWAKSSPVGILANSKAQDRVMVLAVEVVGQQGQNSLFARLKGTSSCETKAPGYPWYSLTSSLERPPPPYPASRQTVLRNMPGELGGAPGWGCPCQGLWNPGSHTCPHLCRSSLADPACKV